MAYLEVQGRGHLVESSDEVARYGLLYDLLRAVALPPDASREMITGLAEGDQPVNADLDPPEWRKSSFSGGSGGNCVEVAGNLPGVIAVRDSKDPGGPVLLYPGAVAVVCR